MKLWDERHKDEMKEYHKEYSRKWYQQNKKKVKEKSDKYYKENKEVVKDRQALRRKVKNKEIKKWYKKYYKDNKEKILKRAKKYRVNNKEAVRLRGRKWCLKQIGWSLEMYDSVFNKQKGVCAICKRPKKGCLDADHEHVAPPKPRGLLCHLCNMGIGAFKDDIVRLKEAMKYLRKFGK